MKKLLALVLFALTLAGAASAAEVPVLTVYTYNSFVSEWGPGPQVKKAFEADCSCRVDFVGVEDGVVLLSRLRLEGAASKADVVLGLDTNLTAEAAATGLFAPHGLDTGRLRLPIAWKDRYFLPYDFGYFAFVYDKTRLKKPPRSLADLVEGDSPDKILIEDPRSSTPGLGLLLWIKQVYGDGAAEVWRKLKPRILTVSKSWDEAYGLFLKGEAPMVLSYTTSPAYHVIEEKKTQYAADEFPEGHYLQVEVAGLTAHAPHPALGRKFLQFMLSTRFQDIIPETNWMYPAAPTSTPLPAAFPRLPGKTLLIPSDEVARHRKAWIDEWLAAMSG
ncbi:MAG TPA: thiamine ABC transporter substrate binding subunit [Dongiaceae bacterium]|nr:thiamine ABC transporter substrate binding subunit [Dongiaceae bacterium]